MAATIESQGPVRPDDGATWNLRNERSKIVVDRRGEMANTAVHVLGSSHASFCLISEPLLTVACTECVEEQLVRADRDQAPLPARQSRLHQPPGAAAACRRRRPRLGHSSTRSRAICANGTRLRRRSCLSVLEPGEKQKVLIAAQPSLPLQWDHGERCPVLWVNGDAGQLTAATCGRTPRPAGWSRWRVVSWAASAVELLCCCR